MVRSLESFNNALYASTYNRNGVFKSGRRRATDGTPIHGGLPTTDVGALAISDGALYLGVNEENFMGTQEPFTGGIYRLADDWEFMDSGADRDAHSLHRQRSA